MGDTQRGNMRGRNMRGALRRAALGCFAAAFLAQPVTSVARADTTATPEISAAAIEASAAAAKFQQATKDVYKTGKAPRLSDAEVAPLIDKVFATDVLHAKVPNLDDRPALFKWLMADTSVGLVYMLAGSGVADMSQLSDDPKAAEKVQAQGDKNVVAYAPELGRYSDATIALDGAFAEVLAAQKTPTDEAEKTGKAKMRDTVGAIVVGVLQTLSTPGLSNDWRRARLAALNGVSPKLAKVLAPAQCGQARDLAGRVAGTSDDAGVKAGVATFTAALKC